MCELEAENIASISLLLCRGQGLLLVYQARPSLTLQKIERGPSRCYKYSWCADQSDPTVQFWDSSNTLASVSVLTNKLWTINICLTSSHFSGGWEMVWLRSALWEVLVFFDQCYLVICYLVKGVDKGGGFTPSPKFLANIIIWRCGHAKVGVVVQKSHAHSLQPPPLLKSCLHPLICSGFLSQVSKVMVKIFIDGFNPPNLPNLVWQGILYVLIARQLVHSIIYNWLLILPWHHPYYTIYGHNLRITVIP